MATGQRLSGINPLAYIGVEPTAPPQVIIQERQPTTNDYSDYKIGTWWLMVEGQQVWILISKLNADAKWIQLYPGSLGGATAFPCDAGTANEANNTLNVFGGSNINTSGLQSTVTINLDSAITVTSVITSQLTSDTGIFGKVGSAQIWNAITIPWLGNTNTWTTGGLPQTAITVTSGGMLVTGPIRFTDLNSHGAMITDASGNVSTTPGANGQVLIGSNGNAPAWNEITSTGGTVLVTNGANSINLETASSSISFMAFVPSNEVYNLTNPQTLLFPLGSGTQVMTVDHNIGGHFFPGNAAGNGAIFTVPSSGRYCFQMTLNLEFASSLATQGAEQALSILIKDPGGIGYFSNSFFKDSSASPRISRSSDTFSIVLNLSQNDIIRFFASAISNENGSQLTINGSTALIGSYVSGYKI